MPGFTDVLVTLTGWGLDYSGGDHRISRAGVRIKDAEYDGGTVRFVVEGSGRDSTAADDYRWTVWYSLLCLGG